MGHLGHLGHHRVPDVPGRLEQEMAPNPTGPVLRSLGRDIGVEITWNQYESIDINRLLSSLMFSFPQDPQELSKPLETFSPSRSQMGSCNGQNLQFPA